MTKTGLYILVGICRDFFLANGISGDITIEKICERFPLIKVEYAPFQTPRLKGLVSLAQEPGQCHCIIINSNISKEEQRFHGIHEYMHTFLHSGASEGIILCNDSPEIKQNSFIEWQANEGAAELIMPYKEFIPEFSRRLDLCLNPSIATEKELFFGIQYDIVTYFANKFGVSNAVVENRISGLASEIDQYRSGVPVEQIRLLSYRNRIARGLISTDYLRLIRKIACKKEFSAPPENLINAI